MAHNALSHKDLYNFPDYPGTRTGHLFSLQDSLWPAISEFCKEKKIMFALPTPYIDFIPPKYYPGKECYVAYYVKSPDSGKMKRFKIKLNHIQPAKERKSVALRIISYYTERLSLGWSPFYCAPQQASSKTLFEVLDAFEKAKSKEMEKQSLASYRSYLRIFRRWLENNGYTERALIVSATRDMARTFLDYLDDRDDVSAATYNNYLSFMVTLFGWVQRRGYLATNIFEGFDRKPKKLTAKKRILFDRDELDRLFNWLRKENPQYLAICYLCYCCFMRPKEISLLKCSDINLQEQTVRVRAEIAKNDNESFRTIPDAAMDVIRGLNLSNPGLYVFGHCPGRARDFSPGKTPTTNKKIYHYWEKFVQPALKFRKGITFYSLKDTGITRTLSEGLPVNLVQQQADHSSVAITAVYVGKTAAANQEIRKIDIINSD